MDASRTVHIVDDDEAIRQSVGFLLRKSGYPLESYPSGTAFLRAVTRETRGCILLDVRMPDLDGLEVQGRLAQQGIGLPVVMLTGHGDGALVRAVKAGAIEFLEKPFERNRLLIVIKAADARARIARLTDRERAVLDGMVRGHPNTLIAFDLGIAARTVEAHRANLMGKLSTRSFSDVLRIAFAAGLGDDA